MRHVLCAHQCLLMERVWAYRLRFPELCEELFERWVGEEISRMELRGVFGQCFAEFSDERIIPLARLPDEDSLFVAELFHGPSLSFKDFGQQVLNPVSSMLLGCPFLGLSPMLWHMFP